MTDERNNLLVQWARVIVGREPRKGIFQLSSVQIAECIVEQDAEIETLQAELTDCQKANGELALLVVDQLPEKEVGGS